MRRLDRVNPRTGIAVAWRAIRRSRRRSAGTPFGADFNPTASTEIRVVSDAGQNLRLNVDEGTVLSQDQNINPGAPQVVGSAYTNPPLSPPRRPRRPRCTRSTRQATGCSCRTLPNNGTPRPASGSASTSALNAGFDIAGADNVGFLARTPLAARHDAPTRSTSRPASTRPRSAVSAEASAWCSPASPPGRI